MFTQNTPQGSFSENPWWLLLKLIFGVFFFLLQKQSKDRFGLEGDEESTMLEESVSPKKYVNQ